MNDFTRSKRRPVKIDPKEKFSVSVDVTNLIKRDGAEFVCSQCSQVLVKIEPNGILGEGLNKLDVLVIQDHYDAKHK